MSRSGDSLRNPNFSHVYVEEGVSNHPRTARILSRIGSPSIIRIRHYKDVFCRKNQLYAAQSESPKLILAAKREHFLYEGSPMCDSFGNTNFHYTTDIMNCIYRCEYCYLQGLYPSANLVVFVNLEDTFHEIERQLAARPIYVCISYDTDLLALENLTGFVAEWMGFAAEHADLTLEIRTKSAGFTTISSIPALPNIVLAWSVSPAPVADAVEKYAPSTASRLKSMKEAIDRGWKVRLCVDPMIRTVNWREDYENLFSMVKAAFPVERLFDISIGVFRVPKDSLKTMRRINPDSPMLAYPFSLTDSGWSYPEEASREMTEFLKERFSFPH